MDGTESSRNSGKNLSIAVSALPLGSTRIRRSSLNLRLASMLPNPSAMGAAHGKRPKWLRATRSRSTFLQEALQLPMTPGTAWPSDETAEINNSSLKSCHSGFTRPTVGETVLLARLSGF